MSSLACSVVELEGHGVEWFWSQNRRKITQKNGTRVLCGVAVSAAEEEIAVIVRSRFESEVALFSYFPCAAAQDGVATKVLAAVAAGSPPPPASAACERSSSRRRRARLTSSATSSRSSRRRRRRQRRSLRRSEVAPVVCESLGLHLSVRSGRGCRSPVWSPRSGVVCACWASGFPYSPKEDHGRLVSSSRL